MFTASTIIWFQRLQITNNLHSDRLCGHSRISFEEICELNYWKVTWIRSLIKYSYHFSCIFGAGGFIRISVYLLELFIQKEVEWSDGLGQQLRNRHNLLGHWIFFNYVQLKRQNANLTTLNDKMSWNVDSWYQVDTIQTWARPDQVPDRIYVRLRFQVFSNFVWISIRKRKHVNRYNLRIIRNQFVKLKVQTAKWFLSWSKQEGTLPFFAVRVRPLHPSLPSSTVPWGSTRVNKGSTVVPLLLRITVETGSNWL